MRAFKCPNCLANELQGNRCAYCGTTFLLDESDLSEVYSEAIESERDTPPQKEEKASDILSDSVYRKYIGCGSNIVLEEDAVIVKIFILGDKDPKWTWRIPYEEIAEMYFYRGPYKFFSYGYIVFHREEEIVFQAPDLRTVEKEHATGKRIIGCFTGTENMFFYHIYCFLKSAIPALVHCEICNPSDTLLVDTSVARGIDFDECFERFSPFRDDAVTAIRKQTGLKKKKVEMLVDQAFDQRQEKLYASNPAAAKEDLEKLIRREIQKGYSSILKKH